MTLCEERWLHGLPRRDQPQPAAAVRGARQQGALFRVLSGSARTRGARELAIAEGLAGGRVEEAAHGHFAAQADAGGVLKAAGAAAQVGEDGPAVHAGAIPHCRVEGRGRGQQKLEARVRSSRLGSAHSHSPHILESGLANVVSSSDTKPSSVSSCTSFSTDLAARGGAGTRLVLAAGMAPRSCHAPVLQRTQSRPVPPPACVRQGVDAVLEKQRDSQEDEEEEGQYVHGGFQDRVRQAIPVFCRLHGGGRHDVERSPLYRIVWQARACPTMLARAASPSKAQSGGTRPKMLAGFPSSRCLLE